MSDKIKISGNIPPAVFRIGAQRYVASGGEWTKVAEATTLSDIEWLKPAPPTAKIKGKIVTHLVPGSNNDRYRVTIYPAGDATCGCWGYRRWRKPCKHIKMVSTVA